MSEYCSIYCQLCDYIYDLVCPDCEEFGKSCKGCIECKCEFKRDEEAE